MADFDELRFAGTTPIAIRVGDNSLLLKPKKFKTGSSGWHANGKITVQGFECQANILLTVVYSKPGSGPKKRPEGGDVVDDTGEILSGAEVPLPDKTETNHTPKDGIESPLLPPIEEKPKKKRSPK